MADKIQFLEYQKPGLEAGDYKLKVEQTLQISGASAFSTDPFAEIRFSVAGERFSLDPSAVHTVYPPAGRLGRYTDVLPHIALKRSTFPWERSAYGNEDFEPWVALLLFDEQEIGQGEVSEPITLTLGELNDSIDADFPTVEPEIGQSDDDQLTVIDVRKSLLDTLLPTGEEMKLLTHVRRRVNGDEDDPETELAIVMANRLPKDNSSSTMHLVSLEGRLNEDGILISNATDETFVRLVSLKSWSFACPPDQGKDFEELVEDLNTGTLRKPNSSEGSTAEPYLSRGYVPLPHALRQTDTTYSWYHGPLNAHDVPRRFSQDNAPPSSGDALVRYHEDIGMLDVSYATAFGLGRVLALEDRTLSTALYQWKQQYNEQATLDLQSTDMEKLMDTQEDTQIDEDPLQDKIALCLAGLSRLEHIPFNYLVPSDDMLPPESIRFFQMDRHWVECLLYGAFTIGGPVREKQEGDHSERMVFDQFAGGLLDASASGFLLRSQIVSDHPDLWVDTYAETVDNGRPLPSGLTKLPPIRVERIGHDTLLCIFQGTMSTAEIFLRPEGLRFGLDEEMNDSGTAPKYEKDIEGVDDPIPLENPFRDADRRILNITGGQGLADRIGTVLGIEKTDAAQFGMHMLEGSNKGRFVVKVDQ